MQPMNLQLQSTLPTNLNVPIIDLRDILPTNPKYTWEKLKGNRIVTDLTTIVLHHDAWPKKNSAQYSDVALATKIANDHISSIKNIPGGDAGFPYDVWIRNGTIYICNDMLPLKFGVSSNNTYTVHACVSGDYYNHDTLTDADRNALYAAIFLYRSMMPSFTSIKAHQELSPTDCPGYDYVKVRDDIAAIDLYIKQQAEQAQTPQKREELAYRIANELLYLYNMSKGKDSYGKEVNEQTRVWAQTRLLTMEPEMRRLGFLK